MSEITKAYLESEDTPASVLVAIAVDEFGGDFFTYEIEVVSDCLSRNFQAVIPEDNIDKLQAMQTIYTTNGMYMSLPTFLALVDALNGNGVDFGYVDLPEVKEVAWALTEALMNVPDEDMDNLLHPDIEVFIRALMKEEGFTKVPSSLGFVKDLDVPEIKDTFLDDPIMYDTYDQNKRAEANAVDEFVSSKVLSIIEALKVIPLKNRDHNSWNSFIESASK